MRKQGKLVSLNNVWY